MKAPLLFLVSTLCAAQGLDVPLAAIFRDAQGALRTLHGVHGAWQARPLGPTHVVSSGYSGHTLWFKTATELSVWTPDARITVPAPSGPAEGRFDVQGQLTSVYFPETAENASWDGAALNFNEPLPDTPYQEQAAPNAYLQRENGRIFLIRPGSEPTELPQAESTTFDLVLRDSAGNETPAGSTVTLPPAAPGDTSSLRLRIRNNTAAAINITRLSLDPPDSGPAPFATFNQFFPPRTIAPSEFADFSLRFQPAQPGDYSTTLHINDLKITVLGSSVDAATVELLEGAQWLPLNSNTPNNLGTVERAATLTRRLRTTPGTPITLSGPAYTLASASEPGQFDLICRPTNAGIIQATLTIPNRTYTLQVTATELPNPKPTLTPASGRLDPAKQQRIAIQFPTPIRTASNGFLRVAFTPISANIADEPAIAFLPKLERQINFRVAEGATQADFSGQDSVLLQTGTTAGTLTLTVDLDNWHEQSTYTLDPAPVTLTAATASTASGKAEVLLTGYDLTRSTTKIAFTFYLKTGQPAAPGRLDANVTTAFKDHFSSSATGAFQLRATFPVSGSTSELDGVEVDITNAQGARQTGRLRF